MASVPTEVEKPKSSEGQVGEGLVPVVILTVPSMIVPSPVTPLPSVGPLAALTKTVPLATLAPSVAPTEETSTFVETPIFTDLKEKDDPQILSIANQLATFRAAPPKASSSAPEFQYHQGDQRKPISLEFEEIEDHKTTLRLRLRSAESGSDPKVEELAKLITNGWNVEIKPRGFKAFEAHVYFLKYRRLEKRDMEALEKLRAASVKGHPCFIFVDEVAGKMDKVIKKLTTQGRNPPGAVFLPWGESITENQLKAVMGLTLSAKFEDVTKSFRSISRVLIPSKRK
jgi:hypothetical protein